MGLSGERPGFAFTSRMNIRPSASTRTSMVAGPVKHRASRHGLATLSRVDLCFASIDRLSTDTPARSRAALDVLRCCVRYPQPVRCAGIDHWRAPKMRVRPATGRYAASLKSRPTMNCSHIAGTPYFDSILRTRLSRCSRFLTTLSDKMPHDAPPHIAGLTIRGNSGTSPIGAPGLTATPSGTCMPARRRRSLLTILSQVKEMPIELAPVNGMPTVSRA